MIEKLQVLLGENNQLCLIKGQIRNIEAKVKENGDRYYTADIRVAREMSDDVYGTSFNIINVCFPSDYCVATGLSDAIMKSMKDNEVVLLLSIVCSLYTNKVENNVYKNNRALFYVEGYKLTRKIDKFIRNEKKYNI